MSLEAAAMKDDNVLYAVLSAFINFTVHVVWITFPVSIEAILVAQCVCISARVRVCVCVCVCVCVHVL